MRLLKNPEFRHGLPGCALSLLTFGLGAQTLPLPTGLSTPVIQAGYLAPSQEDGTPTDSGEKRQGLDLKPFGTWHGSDVLPFLGGGLLGLALHESGHLATGYALNAHPSTKRVSGGGASFFAIRYGRELSPREVYAISSAGFLFQFASAEWVLKKHPRLWTEEAPVAKGVFAFHLITSFVYAYGALTGNGPTARDTLGMARSLGIHERWIGVAVLAPALLDLYRSFHPEAKWAVYTSRSVKVSFVLGIGAVK